MNGRAPAERPVHTETPMTSLATFRKTAPPLPWIDPGRAKVANRENAGDEVVGDIDIAALAVLIWIFVFILVASPLP